MMQVIRLKADPTKIKAFGFTQAGGLGDYDTELFEEVEVDELPKEYKQVVERPLAMGRDLASRAEKWIVARNQAKGISFADRQKIWAGIVGFFQYCNSEEANPLTQAEFDEIVAFAKQSFISFLTPDEIKTAKIAVDEWVQSVRFDDESKKA